MLRMDGQDPRQVEVAKNAQWISVPEWVPMAVVEAVLHTDANVEPLIPTPDDIPPNIR